MTDKLIPFSKKRDILLKLGREKIDAGDKISALNFFYDAYELNKRDCKVLSEIANCYSDFFLFRKSNKFWLLYLLSSKKSTRNDAYEGLSKNCLFLNEKGNVLYYVNKCVKESDFNDEEITEKNIFESADISKYPENFGYFIVYPKNKVNSKFFIEKIKDAFISMNFFGVLEVAKKISEDNLDLESMNFVALSYFYLDNENKFLELCKKSIARFGENIISFCSLYTYYNKKKNKDKCDYYYSKCVDLLNNGSKPEICLINCAMLQNDNKIVKKLILDLKNRNNFSYQLEFTLAISYINLYNFIDAEKILKNLRLINRENVVVELLYKLCQKLLNNNDDFLKYLPLKYEYSIPKKMEDNYKKIISSVFSSLNFLRKLPTDFYTILKWGFNSRSKATITKSAIIAVLLNKKEYLDLLLDALIDTEINSGDKAYIVSALINIKYNDKIIVELFNKIIIIPYKKMLFYNFQCEQRYLEAYAKVITNVMYVRDINIDKPSFIANMVFAKYSLIVDNLQLNGDELACLIHYLCKYRDTTKEYLCNIYNLENKRFDEILNEIPRYNHGKNS